MKYLLDTHAILWFLTNKSELPDVVLNKIVFEKDVFVSKVSFWEMAIKKSIGKLKLDVSIKNVYELCLMERFGILEIAPSHMDALQNLPFIHNDPFDRLLICQAQVENFTFITRDMKISKYDVKTFW